MLYKELSPPPLDGRPGKWWEKASGLATQAQLNQREKSRADSGRAAIDRTVNFQWKETVGIKGVRTVRTLLAGPSQLAAALLEG